MEQYQLSIIKYLLILVSLLSSGDKTCFVLLETVETTLCAGLNISNKDAWKSNMESQTLNIHNIMSSLPLEKTKEPFPLVTSLAVYQESH